MKKMQTCAILSDIYSCKTELSSLTDVFFTKVTDKSKQKYVQKLIIYSGVRQLTSLSYKMFCFSLPLFL